MKRQFEVKNPPAAVPRYMDMSSVLTHYLLIHDVASGLEFTEAQKKYANMQRTFGARACSMVTINSLAEAEPNPLVLGGQARVFISKQDAELCKSFATTFVADTLLPHLQQALQNLHEEVTKARGGFGHKMKLWMGNSFSSKQEDQFGQRFEVSSLEFRERRLADWAFLLGDYVVAYRTYKSLIDIYKNEQAYMYQASAHEMAANCLTMWKEEQLQNSAQQRPTGAAAAVPQLPYQWQDVENQFEEAWQNFLKAGRPAWARRASLCHAFWSQWRLQNSAANLYERLADQPNVDSLERALLLQQAAISFLLRPSQPRLRMFAFQSIQAADSYSTANQLVHALSAYRAAYNVYESRRWTSVDDHLHARISRLAFTLGKHEMAMKFVNLLLEHNNQSADLQNSYLREFIFIYTTAESRSSLSSNKALTLMPLPVVGRAVNLHLNDFVTNAGDPEWALMEESMLELIQPPEKRNVWHLIKKANKTKEQHVAVVGETIFVELELRNPLKVPVQFTSMHLECVLVQPADTPPASPEAKLLEVEHRDTLLGPLDLQRVQFALKPLVVGTITVTGIRFKVCGAVEGVRELSAPRVIKVTTPLPRLQPQLIDWPEETSSLLVGQVHKSTLRLANVGKMPLKNLCFTSSHPHFFASEHFNDSALIQFLSTPTTTPALVQQQRGWIAKVSLPAPLEAGAHVELPLWLRPCAKGAQTFKFLFYYEPIAPNPDMKHRLQRAVAQVKVIPSLKLNAGVRPDPTFHDHYILAVEAENMMKQSSKTQKFPVISLRQFRIYSGNWTVSFLSSGDSPVQSRAGAGINFPPAIDIQPRETHHIYFAVRRKASAGRFLPAGPSSQPTSSVRAPQILLPLLADSEPEIIMLSPYNCPPGDTPLAQFLQRERVGDKVIPTPAESKRQKETTALFDSRTREEVDEQNRIARFNDSNRLHIVVNWEISTRTAVFQHNLVDLSFVPAGPWLGTSDTKCPLRFHVRSSAVLKHDFRKGFCVVPISFQCFNASPFSSLSFVFEGLKPFELIELPDNKHASKSNSDFFWGGSTRMKINLLKPETSTSFEVQAIFPAPGRFNVNRFKFSVSVVGAAGGKRHQVFSTSQLHVIIEPTLESSRLLGASDQEIF